MNIEVQRNVFIEGGITLRRMRWVFRFYISDSYGSPALFRLSQYVEEERASTRHRWRPTQAYDSSSRYHPVRIATPGGLDRTVPNIVAEQVPVPSDVLAEARQKVLAAVEAVAFTPVS